MRGGNRYTLEMDETAPAGTVEARLAAALEDVLHIELGYLSEHELVDRVAESDDRIHAILEQHPEQITHRWEYQNRAAVAEAKLSSVETMLGACERVMLSQGSAEFQSGAKAVIESIREAIAETAQ